MILMYICSVSVKKIKLSGEKLNDGYKRRQIHFSVLIAQWSLYIELIMQVVESRQI